MHGAQRSRVGDHASPRAVLWKPRILMVFALSPNPLRPAPQFKRRSTSSQTASSIQATILLEACRV